MPDTTFWTGPVSIAQTSSAVVPGSEHKVIECRGSEFTPLCRELSASLLDVNGRRLPNLLIRLGTDVEHLRDLVIAAFSAGGSLVRTLVSHPADRAMVRAVMLSDATYADWGNDKKPLISQDWLNWGSELARGANKLWVATASPIPDRTRPSGVQVLQELRAQLERKVGQKFQPLDGFFGIDPLPAAAWRLGNVVLAEYAEAPLHHGGHVELAKQTFSKILIPWLAAGGSFEPSDGNVSPEIEGAAATAEDRDAQLKALFLLCAIGGAAGAYSITRWFIRRFQKK